MKKSIFARSSLSLAFAAVALAPAFAFGAVHNVSTIAQLKTALTNAANGDEIVIAAGTYAFSNATKFTGTTTLDGVNPVGAMVQLKNKSNVTIRGASASNRPLITGYDLNGDYVVYLQNAPGTILKDLRVSGAEKGIIVDRSNSVRIQNVEVFNTGSEGIHIRDGSDSATIVNNNIHDIGLTRIDRGEGVYIGSDQGKWFGAPTNVDAPEFKDGNCDNNLVKGNTIGPNVGAELIDEKEGTRQNTYRNNTLDMRWTTNIATPNTLAEWGVLLKGYRAVLIGNSFITSSTGTPKNGGNSGLLGAVSAYQIIDTSLEYGFGHFIANNTMTGDDAALYMAKFTSNGGAQLGCNTAAVPAAGLTTTTDYSYLTPTETKPHRYYSVITGAACTTYPAYTRDDGTPPASSAAASSVAASSTPASSTPASSTPASSAAASSAAGGCLTVTGTVATEVNMTGYTCLNMAAGLSGKTFAVWDSDTNTSCDWRGTATPQSGGTALAVTLNYVVTASPSGWSGNNVTMADSNGCKFVKVRVY